MRYDTVRCGPMRYTVDAVFRQTRIKLLLMVKVKQSAFKDLFYRIIDLGLTLLVHEELKPDALPDVDEIA